jgi:hypothetical protein
MAMLLPFITGFGDAPPENTEQVTTQKTILFPEDPLFCAPLASHGETGAHALLKGPIHA